MTQEDIMAVDEGKEFLPSIPNQYELDDEAVDNIIKEINTRKTPGGYTYAWDEERKNIRRQAIIKLIQNGHTKSDLYQILMKRWNCSKKQAGQYISDCLKKMTENIDEYGESVRNLQQERLEKVAQIAIDRGQLREAVLAYAEINRLLGLDRQRTDLGQVNTVFNFGGEAFKDGSK